MRRPDQTVQHQGKFFVNLRQILTFLGVEGMPGGFPRRPPIRIGRHISAGLVALAGVVLCAPASAGGLSFIDWLTTVGQDTTTVEKSTPYGPEGDRQAPSAASEAVAVEVIGDRESTLFQLTLSRGVTAEVYSLANPYRVVIDLPNLSFRLPEEAGRTGRGLVSAFRYGQFAEGKARIVMDTEGPVAIAKAAMTNARDGNGVVLTVELKPSDPAAFGQGTGGGKREQSPGGSLSESVEVPAKRNPGQAKPVIVIDPGHGGIDPGAVGSGNLLEKDLVLKVARKVRDRLLQKGRYDVIMTRSSDVFVSLSQRLAISRQSGSDLFISIHADSIEEAYAQNIKGATIYTLSERASDAQARAMADKENASDLIAGLDVSDGEEGHQVKNILIDLMKRETANFSAEFSRTLVRKMRRNVSLSRDPERSAAFKVLKQPHAPSVLVELGYLSNAEEAERMQSAQWQDKVVGSITGAVDAYFVKRTVGSP